MPFPLEQPLYFLMGQTYGDNKMYTFAIELGYTFSRST